MLDQTFSDHNSLHYYAVTSHEMQLGFVTIGLAIVDLSKLVLSDSMAYSSPGNFGDHEMATKR